MYKPKRSRLILLAVLTTLLLLTACQAAAPTASPQAADSERASTLNIAVSRPFASTTNYNIYTPGFDRSRTGLGALVHEYLFYLNMETGEYVPWLAESYRL